MKGIQASTSASEGYEKTIVDLGKTSVGGKVSFSSLLSKEMDEASEYLKTKEEDLILEGTKALNYFRQIKFQGRQPSDDLLEKLRNSIDNLAELLFNFANPDSLDILVDLFTEVDDSRTPSVHAQVEAVLINLISLEELPLTFPDEELIDEELVKGESPKQLAYEMQQELLQGFLTFQGDLGKAKNVINAFLENPNFTDDPLVKELAG